MVGVADGSNVKMYVNGVLQTVQNAYDGTIASPTQNFNIGRQPSYPLYYWDGELSNISVFNTGLTGPQVTTLYNSGKPLTDMSSFTSLQGWWKLDDTATFNSGTSVWSISDASSNSNTGTSVGMNASNLVASNINGELIANPMITNPKPIAYYQLGDQSVDNGANLLVPNNSLSDYVFDFDGSNDYIDLGTSFNTMLQLGDSFSISVWVNFNNTASNRVIISNLTNSITGFHLRVNPDESIRFILLQTNSIYLFVDSSSLSIDTWHHVVCTYDGSGTIGGLNLYINSSLDNNNTVAQGAISTTTSTDSLRIAKDFSNTPKYFNGKISNAAIFNTELSSTQIETIYNNGAPNNISSLSPTAWYKLNASEIFNSISTEWSVDNNAYPSVYQSSLDFNGSSNYIDCGDSDDLSFGNGTTDSPFSISAWINMTSNASVFRIVNKYDTNYEYQFDVLSGVLRFYILNDPFTGYRGITGSTLNTGQWHHVVATYSGVGGSAAQNGMELYVNGQNVVSSASTFGSYTAMSNTTAPVYIGRVTTTYSNGEISNAAIFNTELTGPQVQTLYNNGTPEASISHSPVSWWKLDNTTTGVQDSAGSNNGTNNGATEYAGFVNGLAGESFSMDSSNLVVSDLQQTSGYSPYALDFDGINDYLVLDSSVDLGINSSISVWVNLDTNYLGVLIGESTYPNGNYFIQSRYNVFYVRIGIVYLPFYLTATALTAGSWHHLAVTRSGDSISTYVDGTFIETKTGYGTSVTTKFDTIADRQTNSYPLEGKITQLSAFNTTLTSTQIVEIYNEGVPGNLYNFSGTAPVAWWQIGSNSSFNTNWTCLDEIGTNNAVSVNMTNDDIVDGVGYSASGLGTSSIDIKGDAPYSTANGLSENMDVLDRTLDTPIRNTHSIQLDGVDDYIDFGNITSLNNLSAFSTSAWINYSSLGTLKNILVAGGTSLSNRFYVQLLSSSQIRYGSSSGFDDVTVSTISSGSWHHIVTVHNGTSLDIYLDGVKQNSSPVTVVAPNANIGDDFTIGRYTISPGYYWNGKLDEVAIFNVELTGPQVAAIYNGGTPNNILPLSPVLWSRFESLTTNAGVVTTADSSGNGLTGTVENGAVLSTVVP